MSKRLKHVYQTGEVFHILFNRPEELLNARNDNANVSWNYNEETNEATAYSYSSEIGIVDFNKKVVFIRNGSYSNTTNTHQRNLFNAIPSHEFKVFYFNHWDCKWYSWYNLDAWCEQEVALVKKSKEQLYTKSKYGSSDIFLSTKDYMQ